MEWGVRVTIGVAFFSGGLNIVSMYASQKALFWEQVRVMVGASAIASGMGKDSCRVRIRVSVGSGLYAGLGSIHLSGLGLV